MVIIGPAHLTLTTETFMGERCQEAGMPNLCLPPIFTPCSRSFLSIFLNLFTYRIFAP
ncbi:hypothetical protein [Niallia endozanthoxylica]|uniref:Uncharacterized protein n=1 Tax=Niallia endozanthoxylica TaxID=2036016 RepID=A0A5J5I2R1_9BACI|nr:hypothetical protein F4V44_03495 [Niallia endozanthoxylica]